MVGDDAFGDEEAFVLAPIFGTAVELEAVAANEGIEALSPALAGAVERLCLGCSIRNDFRSSSTN